MDASRSPWRGWTERRRVPFASDVAAPTVPDAAAGQHEDALNIARAPRSREWPVCRVAAGCEWRVGPGASLRPSHRGARMDQRGHTRVTSVKMIPVRGLRRHRNFADRSARSRDDIEFARENELRERGSVDAGILQGRIAARLRPISSLTGGWACIIHRRIRRSRRLISRTGVHVRIWGASIHVKHDAVVHVASTARTLRCPRLRDGHASQPRPRSNDVAERQVGR